MTEEQHIELGRHKMNTNNLLEPPAKYTKGVFEHSRYQMEETVEVVVKQLDTHVVVEELPREYPYLLEQEKAFIIEKVTKKVKRSFVKILEQVVQVDFLNEGEQYYPYPSLRAKLHLPLVYDQKMVDLESKVKYSEGKMNASEIKNSKIKKEIVELTKQLEYLRLPFYKRWMSKFKNKLNSH